jgi:hypothetical protein
MRNLMFLALGLCLGMYISRLKNETNLALHTAKLEPRTPAS